MPEIIPFSKIKGLLKPKYSFLESVHRLWGQWAKEPGLILGIEFQPSVEQSSRFTFEGGEWMYGVYSEASGVTAIFDQIEDELESTEKIFYQSIPRPSSPPLFKIGDIFDNPDWDSDLIVCSCQWGSVEGRGNIWFEQGWKYLVYWTCETPDESGIYWDLDGLYTEAELSKLEIKWDKQESLPA